MAATCIAAAFDKRRPLVDGLPFPMAHGVDAVGWEHVLDPLSNAAVNNDNLKDIRVPTLIVHTKHDEVASHDASQRAAERIPGARCVSLESGGHPMIGQTEIVRDELAKFFAEKPERGAERVAS